MCGSCCSELTFSVNKRAMSFVSFIQEWSFFMLFHNFFLCEMTVRAVHELVQINQYSCVSSFLQLLRTLAENDGISNFYFS